MQVRIVTPFESPPRAIAAGVGVLCVVSAVVGGSLSAGGVEVGAVDSPTRQIGLALVGLLVAASSLLAIHAAEEQEPDQNLIFADSVLVEKILDAMPPMFLKKYPKDEHVFDNRPFDTFQGDKPKDTMAIQSLITSDHRRGDQIAAQQGFSVQLETSDPFPSKKTQLILTFKKRIEHNGEVFIAGWYIPIHSRSVNSEDQQFFARKLREMVLFEIVPSPDDDDDPFVIDLGMSLPASRSTRMV